MYAVPLWDAPLALQVALDCVRFCLNLTASFPDMGRSPLLLPLVIEMARMLPMYPSDEVGTGCKGVLTLLQRRTLEVCPFFARQWTGVGGGGEGRPRSFCMTTRARN